MSYARCRCVSNYQTRNSVYRNSPICTTLASTNPAEFPLYLCPDHQPPPFKPGGCQQTTLPLYSMSTQTLPAGDKSSKAKVRNTNNSASRELVTPLASKKKGKGVAMTEELDPDATPPTIGNPLPATGPVLSGPHTIDRMNTGDTPSNPAASTSANRMPAPSRGATKSPAARKSANYPKPPSANKSQRKPSSASATQSIATNATTPSANADDETQASSSSQNEVEDDLREIMVEDEASPSFHSVFYDIEAAKNIPIWVEPISESAIRMFGAFNPAVDEDVLVPLGAVDGVLPGRSKHECDRLRNAVEMVYKTPRDCRWEFLGSAIKDFAAHNISKNDLVRHTGQGVTYGVERNQLLTAAQVVVTVDQVLQVLAEFFRKQERERFVLDQGFSFLRLLACHSSRTEILATYRVLQYRTTVASKHLVREINSLTRMYGSEADKMSISSYESSRSSFRSLFGNGSARNEVGRLLARPEYFNKMPEDLTEIAAYLRDRAYKDRPKPKEFSVHRSRVLQDNDEAKSTTSRNSTTPTTGPPLARNHAASEGQSIRFATDPPVPNSISASLSRRHAVTRLPGAGNTFHSSTDSGRNRQESNWNRQRVCFFRLYLLNLLLIYAYQDPYTLTYVI